MYAKQIVSAIAAVTLVSGAAALSCKDATATIQSAADATTIASCRSVDGSVEIDSKVAGIIDLSGQLTEINGDLTVKNNSGLISFSSSSLRKIGGVFRLEQIPLLSTLNFATLSQVRALSWVTLNQLGSYTTTGNGIIAAESVLISDTFLDALDGINIRSLSGDMRIDNNKRLTKFTTQLNNLTGTLTINANGQNLDVSMPNLIWIKEAAISNVTSFSAQSLAAVNGSIRFDSNYFDSIIAPNLTQIGSDLSFVSNGKVTNISFPLLTKVGGGFTIANNTALEKLNGFPALTEVGGAVKLRGSFSEISLPKLNDVKGAFDASSTQSIDKSCETLNKLKSGGQIQGGISCTSNNQNANNDTSSAGGTGSGSGSGSGTSNKPNGASPMSTSMSTVITLAAVGALVSAFL